MAAEAQKVIPGKTSTRHGAQEMSIAVDRLVDTIAGMLLQLPAPQRLEVLRQVEARVKPVENENVLIRKVSKGGRASYFITLPNAYAGLIGEYLVHIDGRRLIYVPAEKGVARVRAYGGRLRLTVPKGAFESIGSPIYVRVRVEGSRIIVEPA